MATRTPITLGNGQVVYYDSSGVAWNSPTGGSQISGTTIASDTAPASTTTNSNTTVPTSGTVVGTYKGTPIYNGTDAQVQAQMAKVDSGSSGSSTQTSGSTGGLSAGSLPPGVTSITPNGDGSYSVLGLVNGKTSWGMSINPTTDNPKDVQRTLNGATGGSVNAQSLFSYLGGSTKTPTTNAFGTIPTGDPTTQAISDAALNAGQALLASGQVPDNLKPTPQLMQDFLAYAHSQADPYTQQLIKDALPNINASLGQIQTQYGNDMSQMIQDFGTSLATEQNQAGASGTAFSGQRQLNESNMANSTNRQLSTLGANAAFNIGNVARQGASQVGTDNAGGITLPTLAGGRVSYAGGQRGSSSTSDPFNLNYTPGDYTVGSIYDTQNKAVNAQAQGYNSAYGQLATQYPGRTMKDLAGQVIGSAGNSLFNNLT